MIDLKNIFQPTPKDEKEIAQAERMLDMTAAKAKRCLEYDDFKSFRESYQRTEAATIDAMISFSKNFIEGHGGIDRYAMTMMRLTTKLETIRHLLKIVESNAKHGAEKETDKE